jgi:WD40 repeat protein
MCIWGKIWLSFFVALFVCSSCQAQKNVPKNKKQSAIQKHAVKVLGEQRYSCFGRIAFLDDDRVVSFSKDSADIIDVQTGKVETVLSVDITNDNESCLSFGSRWFVTKTSGQDFNEFELFDIESPKKRVELRLKGSILDITEDGSLLLVQSSRSLELVRSNDGSVASTWEYPERILQVDKAQFSNQDSALAIACISEPESDDDMPPSHYIFVECDRDKESIGEVISSLSRAPDEPFFMIMEAVNDGPFVFFLRGDGEIAVYDFVNENRAKVGKLPVSVLSVDMDRSRGILLTGGVSGFIDAWDLAKGESLLQIRLRFKGSSKPCFSPNRRLIAAGVDGRLRFWNTRTGREVINSKTEQVLGALKAVAISPDEKSIAVADSTGLVEVWNVKSGAQTPMAFNQLMPGDKRNDCWISPNFLSFSNDGKYLLGGSDQTANLVNVWNAKSGDWVERFAGHDWPIMGVAWSPDDSLIASAGRGNVLRVLRPTGEVVSELTGTMGPVFLPDGKHIVVTNNDNDNDISIFDLVTGREVTTLKSPEGNFNMSHGLAVSPSGDLIAAAYQAGAVVVWEVESGKIAYTKKMEVSLSLDSATGAVAFSNDGKSLAFSASGSKEIWVLDAKSGDQKLKLVDTAPVQSLAYGKTLLVSVAHNHATLWKTEK